MVVRDFELGGFGDVAAAIVSSEFSVGSGVCGVGGLRLFLRGWWAKNIVYRSLRGTS